MKKRLYLQKNFDKMIIDHLILSLMNCFIPAEYLISFQIGWWRSRRQKPQRDKLRTKCTFSSLKRTRNTSTFPGRNGSDRILLWYYKKILSWWSLLPVDTTADWESMTQKLFKMIQLDLTEDLTTEHTPKTAQRWNRTKLYIVNSVALCVNFSHKNQ